MLNKTARYLVFGISLIFLLVPPSHGKPLTIVYANKWAPLSSGDGGAVSGILPTLLTVIITDRMGQNIQHIGVPWKRAQAMVRSGIADAFITTPTKGRLQFTERSENPVYSLAFRAFVSGESAIYPQLKNDAREIPE